MGKINFELDSEVQSGLSEILLKWSNEPGSLISLLQKVQTRFNYLPPGTLPIVARHFSLPLSQVVSVATFYDSFSLKPRGRHILTCCQGTACHVRGAERVIKEVSNILSINPGETTEDLIFSFDTVRCLGACALAPVMMIDGVYHGKMTPKKVKNILQQIIKKES